MELIVGSLSLAQMLEASDARNAALLAAAQARLQPASGATCFTIAGGSVAFAGPGSPLTHAIGIGMPGPVSAADLDCIEHFYRERACSINIDLCPLADPGLAELLGRRGYRPVEFNSVMVRRIESPVEFSDPRIVRVHADDAAMWSRVLAEGFFEHDPTLEELALGDNLFAMEGASVFMVRVDGSPAAGGAMNVNAGGLATLFGDATLKEYRGRGLQTALILTRLADASVCGATLAAAATVPGTVSHRNYERCGFRVAYTKVNMQRD